MHSNRSACSIFARLRAEGWGDELDKLRTQIDPFGPDPLWKLYDCPGFYVNMPLTEKGWFQSLRVNVSLTGVFLRLGRHA